MAFTPPKWGVSSYNLGSLAAASTESAPQPTGYLSAIEGANVVPSKANQSSKATHGNPEAQSKTVSAVPPKSQHETHGNPLPDKVQPVNTVPVTAVPAEAPSRTSMQEPSLENLPLISPKITKVNALKKVIDFNDKLVLARIEDYANVHGRGGKGHNGNSTVGVIICDYTKGKGENSITLSYNIDASSIALLLDAGLNARQGLLKPETPLGYTWADKCLALANSWAKIPMGQDGTRPIHRNELNALHGLLDAARAEMKAVLNAPVFNYSREKNNPYAKTADGFVPVSRIDINYTPYRQDGSKSNYPWYIGIKNFEAPLNTSSNGATAHISSKARNVKTAFINLSADDFCERMADIDSFIRAWELQALPMMKKAYQIKEMRKQLAANKQ